MTTSDDNKTFCSSKGVILTLTPVSQFKIDAVRTSKEEISVPTYEMKVVGGESFSHPMDEEIAKNQGRLDEWDAYLAKKKALDAERTKNFTELLIWEGVCVEVPGIESSWQKECEHFGLSIPEEPIARKLFYVFNELVGTGEDLSILISQILSVSQIDQEVVDRIRASFRTSLSRKADSRLPPKQRKVDKPEPNLQRS